MLKQAEQILDFFFLSFPRKRLEKENHVGVEFEDQNQKAF